MTKCYICLINPKRILFTHSRGSRHELPRNCRGASLYSHQRSFYKSDRDVLLLSPSSGSTPTISCRKLHAMVWREEDSAWVIAGDHVLSYNVGDRSL